MNNEKITNKSTRVLLKFLNETIEGKYTVNKPVLVDIKFRRINIQVQDENFEPVNYDENFLYGRYY
ncbi:MAG: hypothetical protein KKD38_08575 [Candidatus Delongbacteria bacterium]|nr:hypothetical protein [Candidatus Delongbacteria bacterium]MCG2761403.1 hypothetical protein [Candidatus Delongbacteria bacterium]